MKFDLKGLVKYFIIGLKIATVRIIAGAIVLIPLILLGMSTFSWSNFVEGAYNSKVIASGLTLIIVAMVAVELVVQGILSAFIWKWK
jgi:hypothetical protein